MASRAGLQIIPTGFGYERPWRLRSWDRFAIPRPYSRARAVVSPMMNIPAGLERDGLEHYRVEVERMLNRLTLESEAWAEAGTRKVNEFVPLRERAGVGRTTAVGWPIGAAMPSPSARAA